MKLTVEMEQTCLVDEVSDIHTRLLSISDDDEDSSFEVSHFITGTLSLFNHRVFDASRQI